MKSIVESNELGSVIGSARVSSIHQREFGVEFTASQISAVGAYPQAA